MSAHAYEHTRRDGDSEVWARHMGDQGPREWTPEDLEAYISGRDCDGEPIDAGEADCLRRVLGSTRREVQS